MAESSGLYMPIQTDAKAILAATKSPLDCAMEAMAPVAAEVPAAAEALSAAVVPLGKVPLI